MGDWAPTATTRSLGPPGVQGDGGRRGGFAASRLTFHRFRGFPAALPGSRLRKPSSARGGFGKRLGVGTGRGRGAAPGPGRRWPSSRSRDAELAAGEDRSAVARRDCPREGARPPLRVWGLQSPSRSRHDRCSQCHGHSPCRGPGAEPVGRGQVPDPASGAPRCPKPQPVPCALLLFGGATWNVFISFLPDSLMGSPSQPILGLTSQTSLLPSAATLAP